MYENKNSNRLDDSMSNMRSMFSELFVFGTMIILALLCFFFPAGRIIIRYSGYLFVGVLTFSCGFLSWDQSMEVAKKVKNGEEGFVNNGPRFKKAIMTVITAGVITALMFIAFFFRGGRNIIELAGYVFFALLICAMSFIFFDIINENRAYKRQKAEEQEKKWAECPYEVEPDCERAAWSEYPGQVDLNPEDVKTSKENEPLAEDSNVAKVYVFDSSSLKNMSGPLYAPFLTEQYGKKVLHLSEEDEACVLDHEIKILMKNNESETFPGYSAYIANLAWIVKASTDCEDVLQREDSIINYLQLLLLEGRNVKLVTDNPHLTDIARKKDIPILTSRELLS